MGLYLFTEKIANRKRCVTVQISITSLSVFLNFINRSLLLKNLNYNRIITTRVFTNGQTWDRVNTLLDRNGSDFQRRAQSSGSRVFGDFGDPKNAKRNTDKHRNTPKEASGAGGKEIGCAGRSHLVHV